MTVAAFPNWIRSSGVSLLLVSLLLLPIGCRSARRGEPVAGPLAVEDPQVERGRIVFVEHCHQCHPGGEGGLGPSLNDKPLPRFLVKTQVRLGLGVMPAFSRERLPPDDLEAMTAYMTALRRNKPR